MTTPINGYCTLAELLAFLPNSSGATTSQLESSIEAASRAIEAQSGKAFFPAIVTNVYDVPTRWFSRDLMLNDDLLEVITFTNGDTTTIASTEYNLYPLNGTPKKRIVIKGSSSVTLEPTTAGDTDAALSVYGVWGMHRNYGAAWLTATTLNGAITLTTATSFTATSGTPLSAGQIIKVDSELMLVTNVSTNTITVTRGWNGSTAATHLTLSTVYIWQVEADIKRATLIQSARYYRRAEAIFGTTGGGEMGAQPVAIPSLDPDVKLIVDGYTEDY
jgi:hypothetical protein